MERPPLIEGLPLWLEGEHIQLLDVMDVDSTGTVHHIRMVPTAVSESTTASRRLRQAAFTEAMRCPLPHLPRQVRSTAARPSAAPPPSDRLLQWRAVVCRVLLSSSVPGQVPLALAPLIASFIVRHGCYGRITRSIVIAAAAGVTSAQQTDSRLSLTTTTYPADLTVHRQESQFVTAVWPNWPASISCSPLSGCIYVQCVDTTLVFDSDCRYLHSLYLKPVPVEPLQPTDGGGGQSVTFMRVVQSSDGYGRLLIADGDSQLHWFSMDGVYERSLTCEHHRAADSIIAAASPKDDAVYIAVQFTGVLRSSHAVEAYSRAGNRRFRFNETTRGYGASDIHLMASPYDADVEWLYALVQGSVRVSDARNGAILFFIFDAMEEGPVSRTASYGHSDAFIDDTLAFHAEIQLLPVTTGQLLPSPTVNDRIDLMDASFTDLACDTEKLELYVFDRCSRRWFVCDARGLVLRCWRERWPVNGPTGVRDSQFSSTYDPVRHRLVCCERLLTDSSQTSQPAMRASLTCGTFITIAQ